MGEELLVPGRLKSRVLRASQGLADKMFAALDGADWRSPPRYACTRIIGQLGIGGASSGDLNGTPVVYLTTQNGLKFIGPDVEERWNCSRDRIQLIKVLVGESEAYRSLQLTYGHYALLHNIIVRYVTEFSAYPYQPTRTQNAVAGDTFLDIGAFRGYVSLKASLKVGASGLVYALEPMSENFDFLQAHAAMNGLENLVCLQSAVSNESASNVEFYATKNQANACVQDHLSGSRRQLSVDNISTQSLVERVMRESPNRVIASITTNGTEMDLAEALVANLVDRGVDYLELVIPIIYTRSAVPAFLASISDYVTSSELDYPWLRLTYRR